MARALLCSGRMRPIALLVGIVFAATFPSYARAAPGDETATITERSKTVSNGVITIDAPPADVYTLMTDYASWRRYLTDIRSVSVDSGGRRDAHVTMSSRALDHEVTVAFDNSPDKLVHFKLVDGPRGARATGDYVLVAIDGGTRTRIEATLYMDVVGVVGIFVTDGKIRSMRRAKLRADLEDLARWVRLQNRRS